MKTHPFARHHWYIVALIALVVGIWFVWPFMSLIALAALMAFLFYRLYERLRKKLRAGAAATLTIIVSILVIVIPTAIILIFTALQLTQLATDLSLLFVGSDSSWNIVPAVDGLNTFLAPITGSAHAISADGIVDFLRTTLPSLLKGAAAVMTNLVGGIPMTIILSIMYVILMYEFLVYGKTITRSIVAISPFQPEVTNMYLQRIGLMADAMAKGQLYISFVISLVTAIIFSIFLGFGDYFVLMTVAFTLLNLIPLGCGVVAIPIALIAMVTGAFWPGLIALVLYIAASNLDAVIRPRIIPRSITLTPGLTMLSAFGGIALFGLMGVVYGPIIMIIIVTSIQMYLDDYNQDERPMRRRVRAKS